MQNRAFRLSNRMRENLSTLTMSILLALIVWFFAIDQENPLVRDEYSQPIPIEVIGPPEGLQTLQDLSRRTVVVTLRAPKQTWQNISAEDFDAFIDLSNLEPGSYELPIQVEPVNPDIEVIDQQPRQLRVQLEPIVAKIVPVQAEIMDSPAFSYEAQQAIIEPEVVTVTGPESQVAQVTSAVGEVFLRSAKSQVERIQQVSPRNAQNLPVERVSVEPQSARIVVPIVQRPGRKEVAVVVSVEGQPAPGYRLTSISSEPGTVILRGSPEALLGVGGFVETPVLNIENATGDVRERLPLILPENVSTLGEASVTALVNISPIVSSMSVSRRPVIQGLNDDLRAEVALNHVDVIVSGPLPRLDALSADGSNDVQVILNLQDLLPGSHAVVPTVVVPDGIQVEGIIPQSVEVTIERSAGQSPPVNGTPDSSSTPTTTPAATGTPTPTTGAQP